VILAATLYDTMTMDVGEQSTEIINSLLVRIFKQSYFVYFRGQLRDIIFFAEKLAGTLFG
jgi:uncharacterized PurR-regulated membrane protein YhhQ (DUF165 family)